MVAQTQRDARLRSPGVQPRRTARCECGRVEITALGPPIVSTICYCDDCQQGARQIEALPNARPVLDPDGGTPLVLYRRDRVERSNGAELLRGYKLREGSPTNRVVATCCNTAMFLDFDRGPHWVSILRARLGGDAPPAQMRLQTKYKPETSELPDDVPNHASFPLTLVAKLVGARVAMLLHR